MTILMLLALLLAICVAAAVLLPYQFDFLSTTAGLVAILSGVTLFIALVSIPLNRMGSRDALVQIEAVRSTKPLSDIQDAAWRMKAAEVNAQLASMKYWNHTAFDVWIPDGVDHVEALQ